jgi:beta-galactosidase
MTHTPAPSFIYSGEMHYFRIPRQRWAAHLDRAVEAGLNTVSTYIPWRWHEPEEGQLDLQGRTRPERDLPAFIDLVEERSLFFSARVGPVCNGEMIYEGLPDWLVERYPETMLQLRHGEAIHHVGAPSYLNPTFLGMVRRWYDQLLPLLVPRQTTRGGCVSLVQLCNEIAMVNWVGHAVDHSPTVDARYRRFLAERYGSIDELNRAHRTGYASFEELEQPPLAYDGCLLRHLDRARFFRDYYAEYYRTLHQAARERGVEVPVIANIPHFYDYDVRGRGIYSPLTTSLFGEFGRKVPGVIFGGAYQPRRVDWDNFHDLFVTSAMVRMIADEDARTICAEMQTGIMYDRPRLYPSDVELNLLSCMASGLGGVNAYMFSGGINEERVGQFGTYHEWQAPVRPDGSTRPHFEVLRRHGAWLARFGEVLAASRPRPTVQLGFYAPQWMTEFITGPFVTALEAARKEGFYDGIARLLLLCGHPFRAVDLERDPLDAEQPFFVFTTGFMDQPTQQRLVDFVRGGGRLYLGPTLPWVDLRGEPCRVLAGALGLASAEAARGVELRYERDAWFHAGEATLFDPPSGARIFLRGPDGRAAAARWRCGEGEVVFCGTTLSDRFRFMVPLFGEMAKALGAGRPVMVSEGDIIASLRTGGERGSFLFLINYHEEPLRTAVSVLGRRLPGRVTVPARSGLILPLDLLVNSGLTIVSSTLAVRDVEETEDEVLLRLGPEAGERGVISLRGELSELVLEGGALRVEPGRGKSPHTLRCRLQAAEATLHVRQRKAPQPPRSKHHG